MLKGSLKLIKDAKKRNKVVEDNNPEEEEKVEVEERRLEQEIESEKQGENLTSEDIAMDLNKAESVGEEERLLQKKVDWTISSLKSCRRRLTLVAAVTLGLP